MIRATNYTYIFIYMCVYIHKEIYMGVGINTGRYVTRKVKAEPLQAWSCTYVSRKLKFPDFMTTAQDGGKVASLTHRPPLLPGNTPGTHFF